MQRTQLSEHMATQTEYRPKPKKRTARVTPNTRTHHMETMVEISGDLDMLMDCKRDQTTPEMVEIAVRGHKAGLICMLERYSN